MSKQDRLVLLGLLIPSALFANYDAQLRALLLRQIQSTFHAPISSLGIINLPIQAGQFLGFFIVRLSDRYGRRPLLLWTIIGYSVTTALTALSWNIYSYGFFQSLSQIFIGGEFGVAVTLLTESVPEKSRGRFISLLLMVTPLGAVLAGLLLALGLLHNSLSWRLFYLLSLPPLVITTLLRPKLKESPLFQRRSQHAKDTLSKDTGRTQSALALFQDSYLRRAVFAVGAVSMLQELALTGTIGWWAYYIESERRISVTHAGVLFALAALVAIPGYLLCGVLMDRLGRKPTLVVYLMLGVAGGVGTFVSTSLVAIVVTLFLASFFGLGVGPVLSAYTAELFPTELRATASGWVRNLFANSGSVLGPALVGVLASASFTSLAVSSAAIVIISFSALSIPIAVLSLKETRGVTLSDITDPPG